VNAVTVDARCTGGFHPLVTPLIPLVTRSSPDPDAAGHDAPRKEK
jgi:hypothetical protein